MNADRLAFILISFVLLCGSPLKAQKSKSQLEKEKKETLLKIQEAEKILKETEGEKKNSLGQLSAINEQITKRKMLIQSIKEEISDLSSEITELDVVLISLQEDLSNLKEEYAAMIVSAEKANSSTDKLSFLFSASDFNQMLMRLKYLEQYADARKTQIEQIQLVSQTLSSQKSNIETKKSEKGILLSEELKEGKRLTSLKSKQSEVVAALGKKEKELKKELNDRKESITRITKLVNDLIAREAKKTASNKYELTPEGKFISASFAENKRKILWPVSSGFISGKYGQQNHPVMKGIIIENPGIIIQTNKGQSVHAVFDGKVTAVASVRGTAGQVVIIQHGEYRTVYSNIKETDLKTGQTIKAKDRVGTVYTDNDGLSKVEFWVTKGGTKMNPSDWLIPR